MSTRNDAVIVEGCVVPYREQIARLDSRIAELEAEVALARERLGPAGWELLKHMQEMEEDMRWIAGSNQWVHDLVSMAKPKDQLAFWKELAEKLQQRARQALAAGSGHV